MSAPARYPPARLALTPTTWTAQAEGTEEAVAVLRRTLMTAQASLGVGPRAAAAVRLLTAAAVVALEVLDEPLRDESGGRLPPPPAAAPAPFVELSSREQEVLQLVASGCTNRTIAARLVLSVRTVETHVARVYEKIGAANRAEAVAYAVRTSRGS